MKNILTEALVNSVTNASFICSYTNSAKLRINSVIHTMNGIIKSNPNKLPKTPVIPL